MQGRGKPAVSASKNRVVAWFENYWYYYKAPVLITVVILALVTVFIIDMVNKEEPDLRLLMVTNSAVPDEEFMYLAERIAGYVTDINLDGKATINPQSIYITDNPTDEYEMMATQQMLTTLIDPDVAFYIVDEYVYDYLISSEAVAPLADFGFEGGEYTDRIKLNETSLMADLEIAKRDDYYFVFKVRSLDSMNDEYVTKLYDLIIDMMRDALGQSGD